MATQTVTTKRRVIKYLNRDFQTFTQDLINYLKIYFPTSYQDFNQSSTGMMMTELMSFIGDNLSFYLDKKFNESFLVDAKEVVNVFKIGKGLGFKAFGKAAAIGTVDGYITVPASSSAGQIIPDMRYAGVIKRGAQLKGPNNNTYETLLDADFSVVDITNPNYIKVANKDSKSGQPTSFALRLTDNNSIQVKAGQTKSTTFTVGTYTSFLKLTLPDNDVLEVLSVTDSQGNTWYETDYLAQDTIFDGIANTANDATQVPYVLTLRSVPYRFITDYDISANRMSLIFGSGDASTFDGVLIPDLGDLSLPLYGKSTFTDFNINPQNFLRTSTLGIAPANTTLTVTYRVGGGLSTNAATSQINGVTNATFSVGNTSLTNTVVNDVKNSFSVLNIQPVQGGNDQLDIEVIKALISAYFAAQARIVTTEDFIVRTLSMPSKFGSVFRAMANVNPLNKNSVNLVVLSQDVNGFITVCPATLKTNIQTYLSRFRMLTDAIEILDGQVVDIGVNFGILVNPDYTKAAVLADCLNSLQVFFNVNNWQLGQPINLTSIHALLAGIPGVLSVTNITINNIVGNYAGRTYNTIPYNISLNTKNNIIYLDGGKIFQVHYPNSDIVGVAQ